MMDRIGQQLGNYRLTRLLGRGGFADVYLGEHSLLGTTVAIKILHTRIEEGTIAQFRQEAQLLASLRHPLIVRVFDFGIAGQAPYLVMDYAPNGTLRTRHAKGTRLPILTVVSYVKQIAEALQYAHDRKIIHRDIKPENMLIGENNEILLSDFGIALVAHSSVSQLTQDIIGTITYMSPEQMQGRSRPASDQYSLGIVVYEWLSGTYPFSGSFMELCTQQMFASPPPLREKVPTISPEVESVVTTALAKDPKQRFGSLHAFATALEQASQSMRLGQRSLPLGLASPLSATIPPSDSMVSPTVTATVLASRPQHLASHPITPVPPSDPVTPIPPAIAQIQPVLPKAKKINEMPAISRRIVLIGAGGLATAITTGTVVSVILFEKSQQPPFNQLFTYQGHFDQVRTVTWSPDSKRIASGSDDHTVQVWDASNGGHVFIYRGHSNIVRGVAWSPNGQKIASSSRDKTVQVWNASDGSHVFTYQGHPGGVRGVSWSWDSKRIASCSVDQTVQVWNATDGSDVVTYRGHTISVNAVAWSPDGKHIASGSDDQTVQVWNATDGSNVLTYKGHNSYVYAIAWSPDGKHIASGSDDQTVQVWNARNGSDVFTYHGHSDAVNGIAWSPDGERIASGSDDKTVQVWNAGDGSETVTYQRHSGWVMAVAWSQDGKRIASGSVDRTVQVWHVG